MTKSLVISLCTVSFFVGTGVGFFVTPEYAQQRFQHQQGMIELGQSDRWLEQRYIDGMISHHLAAIHLAEQALAHSQREEIKSLAQAIIEADQAGIAELYQWKKDWYKNNKTVENFTRTNLGAADSNFDLRFINAHIIHHEEAIAVNKDVQTKSSNSEVLTLASKVVTGLAANRDQLLNWRKDWYAI